MVHDEDLAAATVDRILERSRLLWLDGPSMRTRHVALDDPAAVEALSEPAIISGIERQEFPEPTNEDLYGELMIFVGLRTRREMNTQ